MQELGLNYRATDIQCALALSQLRRLPAWTQRRQAIAARYDEALSELPALIPLRTRAHVSHAHHLYVVRLQPRLLGADRTNENVASFYQPCHPSVLRALKQIVAGANRNKTDVSVCGDIPLNEKYIAFLLGIGLRTLSVEPAYIPRIQNMINAIDIEKARGFAEELLAQDTIAKTVEMLEMGRILTM